MQAVGTAQQSSSRGMLPALSLLLLATLVAVGMAAIGPLVMLPIFGLLFFALVVARPEYGIALFLSTFLVTYPAALQGTGALTINNLLGGIFVILLSYKMYSEPDWWFLRLWELRLLAFIYVVFYIADRLNGPDPRMMSVVGILAARAESPRTFLTRSVFTVFFVNYIRRPSHVIMIYLVALVFMIGSAISGVRDVMHGGGLHGYRAVSSVIAAAANPNRLAMFAIIPIAGLWYLMRSMGNRLLSLVILPTIAILVLAVFMSGSRSGLLGLGVCGLAILIDERLKLTQMLGLALIGALGLVMVVQFVPQKTLDRITNLPFTQSGDTGLGSGSLERRQYGWKIGMEMWEKHPFIGIGIGNWELMRFLTDPERVTAAPHSSYILALVEGGLVCLSGFLLLLWQTWRNFRYSELYISRPGSPLASLNWVVKSAKVALLVLVFFSLFADLWQLVIVFWLVGLGIVFRRMIDQLAIEGMRA